MHCNSPCPYSFVHNLTAVLVQAHHSLAQADTGCTGYPTILADTFLTQKEGRKISLGNASMYNEQCIPQKHYTTRAQPCIHSP